MQDLNHELFSEAVANGADLVERGVSDFSNWSRSMVNEFGDNIRPHLERVWASAQDERQRRQTAAPTPPPSAKPDPSSDHNSLLPRCEFLNSARATLKTIGMVCLSVLIMVGAVVVVWLLIEGGVSISAKIYPWLSRVTGLAVAVTLFLLLPLAAFKKTRLFAGKGIYSVSYLFGFCLWVWALLVTYSLWGGVAVLLGLFLLGVGVVPMAVLATLLNGIWFTFGGLILLLFVTFGSRFLGVYVLTKTEDYDAVVDPEQSEPPVFGESPVIKDANYFVRHWRGELPLPVSYWVNGILGCLLVAILSGVVSAFDATGGLKAAVAAGILLYALSFAVSVWQIVGTWRSASNHAGRGGNAAWAGLAKVVLVLGAVNLVRLTASTTVPQIVEYSNILAGDTKLPPYEIRVLPGGNEVEFSGGIRAGSAKELERILSAVTQVKVLHVNSIGGRIREAELMAELVRKRGLTTYTSEECLSAATLVFIAGKERVVSAQAKIGFHQGWVPGMTEQQRRASDEALRQTMLLAGVSDEFITHVLATPHENMWYPSVEEMRRAGVITSQSFGERFAVTGKQRSRQQARQLADNMADAFKEFAEGRVSTWKASGDTQLDNAIQPVVDSFQGFWQERVSMERELAALKMRGVAETSVLNSKPSLETEARKRIVAQEITEKFRMRMPSAIEAVRRKLAAIPSSNAVTKGVVGGALESLEKKVPEVESLFTLRLRQDAAEHDLLLFLAAVFDDYKLKDNVISFGSTANIKKYDALVKNIEDIEREVEAFNKRQLDSMESGKRMMLQGLDGVIGAEP